MENRRILVSGAGIAGPMLAYWFKRYGFEATVVERAPRPREGGYIFHFHGKNGIEVARRAGVWERIVEKRRVDKETLFVDRDDAIVAKIKTPAATASVEPSGAQYTLKRADVARILYEHTKDDVEYIFGDSLARITEDASGVGVAFEKGGSAVSTSSSARTACIPSSARSPSATRRSSSGISASTWRDTR